MIAFLIFSFPQRGFSKAPDWFSVKPRCPLHKFPSHVHVHIRIPLGGKNPTKSFKLRSFQHLRPRYTGSSTELLLVCAGEHRHGKCMVAGFAWLVGAWMLQLLSWLLLDCFLKLVWIDKLQRHQNALRLFFSHADLQYGNLTNQCNEPWFILLYWNWNVSLFLSTAKCYISVSNYCLPWTNFPKPNGEQKDLKTTVNLYNLCSCILLYGIQSSKAAW